MFRPYWVQTVRKHSWILKFQMNSTGEEEIDESERHLDNLLAYLAEDDSSDEMEVAEDEVLDIGK